MTDDLKEWGADFPDETERAMAEDIALQCGEIHDQGAGAAAVRGEV